MKQKYLQEWNLKKIVINQKENSPIQICLRYIYGINKGEQYFQQTDFSDK